VIPAANEPCIVELGRVDWLAVPLGFLRSTLVVRFLLGLSLLLSAACNSRNPLFDNAAAPTAPTAPPSSGVLFGVSVTPTGVMGGTPVTGIVDLLGPAPTGGLVVSLSSSSAAVTVPATVTVPGGAERATFAVVTRSVGTDTDASISAAASGHTVQTRLGIWSEQPTYLNLWYEPNASSYVIGQRYTPPAQTFSVSCYAGGIRVSVFTGISTTEVTLETPRGTPMRPGTYENARSTSDSGAGPGLSVGGPELNSCANQSGRFVVHDVQYVVGFPGTVHSFIATFERTCSANTRLLRGELRLRDLPSGSFGPGCTQ